VGLEFVNVAKVGDIPKGGMKGFSVSGKKILVAEIGGKFYAIASKCTHLGGPLEKGKLDGKVVKCPWHGSLFDVTSGKAVGGPANKDCEKYDVKIEKGEVLVNL
jgi:nitrite reductase/ring-hydroxylating ferredoxin subunit